MQLREIRSHLWSVSNMDSVKLVLFVLLNLLYFSSVFKHVFLVQKYLGKESHLVSYSLCCSDTKGKGKRLTKTV